jgi:glutaminase
VAEHEFCRGLSSTRLARLDAMLERRRYAAGRRILSAGATADGIYLILEGVVSILITTASGQPRRVATLSAGMTFGELATLDAAPRSADVRADVPVTCAVLDAQAFERLDRTDPDLKIALLANMLRIAHRTVGRLSEELVQRDA